ncbi:UvrD-helicase domain-containing protein [bacterium]|nr:UvrD-helicase domain-containing protein [Mariniblastus sp.]MDB4391787.1 UvrD-helicase domain-containing protein [bacterium]
MATLMVHRNILKNFHKLPSKVQKRVSDLIEEFQRDPESDAIGMHPLPGTMLDSKVRGIKKLPDGYRAIVIKPERGDTYLLVHIDAHNKAYKWAQRKRFEVHKATGVFQVFDVEEVQTVVESKTQISPEPVFTEEAAYPLARFSEDELFTAGVPKPLLPAVKSIKSDNDLDALSSYLPPDCRDILFGLAAGMTLDEALAEMLFTSQSAAERKPDGPGDFSKINPAFNFDLVLVKDQEELKNILEASLEDWRVFLHPYQRKLVNWKTKGPMKITGAAGTGKTVALIHRVVQLARALAEDEKKKVLVTTFTTNLSYTIRHAISQLAPEILDTVDVTNLHTLSRTICSRSGWNGRIAEKEDLGQVWDSIWLAHTEELPMSRPEMQLEYERVIEQNGIDNEDDYLTAVRSARPRITRKDRRSAWPVFQSFKRGLKKRQLLTFEGAIHQARLAVEQGNFSKYQHVLVDEVQDFSLEALRLIRALSPIEEGTPDPLCVIGDGHQRVYGTKVPMSRAGIEVRGRSRRLKINYRTSEQIRRFAQGILEGVEADDLDGGTTTTLGDHCLFQGPLPLVEKIPDSKSEAEAAVAWVQMLLADESLNLKTHEICVTPYKPEIRTALASASIETLEINAREEDPGEAEPGIRLASMQRIKGLEFRAVLMCCSDPTDPMNDLSNATIRDRCERYVAATRARERLFVSIAAATS